MMKQICIVMIAVQNDSFLPSDIKINGSSLIVGLFETVRDSTKYVGDIIEELEINLDENRETVVDLADTVDDRVLFIEKNHQFN